MSLWELYIYKRTFWKTTHPTVFLQETNCIPGVSRSSGHPVLPVPDSSEKSCDTLPLPLATICASSETCDALTLPLLLYI